MPLKRFFFTVVALFAVAVALGLGLGWWWVNAPLAMPAGSSAQQPVEVNIPPGSSSRAVARAVAASGVAVHPLALYAWFRVSGQSTAIKAGFYEVTQGATPKSLLDKLVRGDQALRSLTLLEGWNSRQVLAAVRASNDLSQDTDGLSDEAVMALIGMTGVPPEGRFFPDTYRMVKHATASSVLRQAALAMNTRLDQAWAQRSATSVLKTPDEALVLASIIEKETGAESDRAMIGGVFNNRLRIGMRLQTDPTVIYGLGERFDGNLRRNDLLTDTPYNTYTRAGLPPTPISMPGWSSLLAAVNPAATPALYFVARGDGSSHFSASLDEHNAAVRRYILNR